MAHEVLKSFAYGTNLLIDRGINLIEWGEQIHLCWGYPAVVSVYDFAIEDSRLEEAVAILENSNSGFKLIDPPLSAQCKGAFGEKGYHFINQVDKKRFPSRIHLIPESLVHLSIQDASLVNSPFDSSRQLYRPKLPELCISLVKCMLDYPVYATSRFTAERSLGIVIAKAIYRDPGIGGKIYIAPEETESEEEFQVRRDKAVQEIQAWELSEDDEPYHSKVIQFVLSNSIE